MSGENLWVRKMFEEFEKAESIEEKTELFDRAIAGAKEILQECEDRHESMVINNLMKTYWVKLIEFIISTGEKTTDDLFRLLMSSSLHTEYVESLKTENPILSRKFDDFLSLVANDKRIMDALQSRVQNTNNRKKQGVGCDITDHR